MAEGARDAPTFPATKNIPAVKNRCFLVPSYDEVTPGPRNAEAVVAIAGVPHPATFGLPPGGRDPEGVHDIFVGEQARLAGVAGQAGTVWL